MTKNAARVCVVWVVVLAMFSMIAFVVPFARETVFWIGYGFGVFVILFQLYIFRISLSETRGANSTASRSRGWACIIWRRSLRSASLK